MKRKSLLVAMAAMSLAAIGAGSVSTLAWFKAEQSLTLSDPSATGATLTVDKTETSVTLNAQVNFIVADPGNKEIELTTWIENVLKKGTLPDNVSDSADTSTIASNVRLENATLADETYKLAVKAYVTDSSTPAEKALAGHDDAWLAEMATYQNDSSKTYHVEYTYTNTTGTGTLLLNTEVYFYCAADETYAEGHEGISGASNIMQQLDVTMAELYVDGDDSDSNPDHWAGADDAVDIGYLYVRFDGSKRVHTQESYTATISASASEGAATANN